MKPARQHIVNSITIKHVRVRASLSPTADDKVAGNHDSAAAALITAWRKIKKLAKTNTALFLGLLTTAVTVMTGLAAVFTYIFNFFVFCVDYGYYSLRFNVPVDLLAQPQAASLSINAVLGIILLLVLTTMNSLGVWSYRNCRSMRLLFAVNSVTFILLLPPFSELLIANFSWSLLIAVIIIITLFSTLITLMLNIALISTFVAPTMQDKLSRYQSKLAKLNQNKNRDKNTANKIAQLEKKIHNLKRNKDKKAYSGSKMNRISLVAACCVFLTVTMLASCVLIGTFIVKPNELTTVAGQEEILQEFSDVLPEEYEANTLAVLYQGDDFLLVAPCMANDGTAIVYSRFQRIISAENTVLIYKINQSVNIQ